MVETYESLLDRISTGSGSDLVSDRNAVSERPGRFVAAALPPDVRRGYASPFIFRLPMGCAPGSGFAQIDMGQRPNQGLSPKAFENLDGGAEPRLTSGGEAAP